VEERMKVPRTRAYRFKRYGKWRLRATKPEEESPKPEPLISRAETVEWLRGIADKIPRAEAQRLDGLADALEEGEG
jgi:hypothetical protein